MTAPIVTLPRYRDRNNHDEDRNRTTNRNVHNHHNHIGTHDLNNVHATIHQATIPAMTTTTTTN